MSTGTRLHGTTGDAVRSTRRRLSTETRTAARTTELFVWLGTVIAIIIAAGVVGADGGAGRDPFDADQALQLITFASIGYLVARGLAKSGSSEQYDA